MPVDDPNVGVAFALVCGAGAATAIGASVVFFPSLVKLASRRVLAGALGLSAGVMTYVSFVEIFQKSADSFTDAGHTEDTAFLYATLCFFGGVITMMIMDWMVKCLSGGGHGHAHDHHHSNPEEESACAQDQEVHNPDVRVPHCVGCSDDPVGELEAWKHMAKHMEEEEEAKQRRTAQEEEQEKDGGDQNEDNFHDSTELPEDPLYLDEEEEELNLYLKEEEEQLEKEKNRKLVSMGVNTALAIGLHNFPEGLATFVASLDDPSVGATLAIAIGIHNIPEGLCVALPIYYATGNRWKAFLWACISGVSEPLAALLGWAILANSFSDTAYAVLFGLVAGMMVMISVKELLPTAHRYDPEDSVVTWFFIVGMVIMALSLVLFVI